MIEKDKIVRYALAASAVLFLMLFLSYICRSIPHVPLILSIAIVVFQVVAPVEILKYCHISAREFNLYAHNIDTILDLLFPPFGQRKIKPDFFGMARELIVFLKVCLVVFIPYIIVYWAFFQLVALKDGLHLVFSLNLPPKIFFELMTQIFVVALPEELFYRGFLQSALLKKWPNRVHFLGFPVGLAIVVTNLIFAFGHVASSMSPIRLLTFFPGLIFSYLVYKNKSLLSAILFHALCNILGQILYSSVFLR